MIKKYHRFTLVATIAVVVGSSLGCAGNNFGLFDEEQDAGDVDAGDAVSSTDTGERLDAEETTVNDASDAPREALSDTGVPSDTGVGIDTESVIDTGVVSTDSGTSDIGVDTGGVDTGSDVGIALAKRIFVSSATYVGNLGGLSGADAKCQSLATAAGLVGTFKAWLSDSTTSAASRLTHSTSKYVLVDGTPVAADWAGLTIAANLLHAIDMTETKAAAPVSTTTCSGSGGMVVWTDTTKTGGIATAAGNCANWTSTAAISAVWGFAFKTDDNWTYGCPGGGAVCDWKAALYCFEQ